METLASIIESILFVSGDAVAVRDISEKLCLSDKEVLAVAEQLQREKYNADSGIHLLIFNKKLQFGTNKNNAESVATVLNPIKERELSRSMLEVAAIIAYKQPVTRMDLEDIRNCSCEYALQNLLKLGVVEVVGRKDSIGHPALFGTTDNFLKRFQISSLDELPDYDGLIEKIKKLHGDDDTYLFKKDVYNEADDPEYQQNNQSSYEQSGTDAENNLQGAAGAVDNYSQNDEDGALSDDSDEKHNADVPDSDAEENFDDEETSEKSNVSDFVNTDDSETA